MAPFVPVATLAQNATPQTAAALSVKHEIRMNFKGYLYLLVATNIIVIVVAVSSMVIYNEIIDRSRGARPPLTDRLNTYDQLITKLRSGETVPSQVIRIIEASRDAEVADDELYDSLIEFRRSAFELLLAAAIFNFLILFLFVKSSMSLNKQLQPKPASWLG